MAIPDFTAKTDPAILQAFQNASAQRANAEAEQRRVDLAEKQQKFNMVKDTATAVGGMVASFVDAAKKRNLADVEAVDIKKFATKQEKTVPAGPTFSETTPAPVSNPKYAERQESVARLARIDSPLGRAAAKELSPDAGRGMISGRDIQQFTLVSPDGQQRMDVSYDEVADTMKEIVSGQPLDRAQYPGWRMTRTGPSVQKDAAGNFQILEPVVGQTKGNISSGATTIPKDKYNTVSTLNDPLVPAEDRKQIISQTATIENDEAIKNAKKLVPTIDNVIRFIDSNNKIAMDRLGGLTQKLVALDSGNLAAWEQRDPNSREIIERIKQYFTMGVKGELTPEAKQELKDLLVITSENLGTNVKESSAVTLNRLEAAYPQMKREYLEELAGLKDFNRYINKSTRHLKQSTKAAPTGLNIDMNAIDAELAKRNQGQK